MIIVISWQIRAQLHRLLQELSILAVGDFIMVEGAELPAAGGGILLRFSFPVILRDALYRSAGIPIR